MKRREKKSTYYIILVLLLSLVLSLVGAFYTNRFFYQEVIEQQTSRLAREIDVLNGTFQQTTLNEYVDQVSHLHLTQYERITILNSEGIIVYDSSKEDSAVGTRTSRPEIKVLMEDHKQQGASLRESHTIGEKLLYVAKPIKYRGDVLGYIRLSEKFRGFSQTIKEFRLLLFIIFSLLLIVNLGLILYVYRRNQQPLKYLIPVIEDAIDKPEQEQVLETSWSDWNQTYELLNQLLQKNQLLYYQQLSNEEKFYFLMNSLNLGVCLFNEELTILSHNQVVEDWFFNQQKEDQFSIQQLPQAVQLLMEQARDKETEVQETLVVSTSQEQFFQGVVRLLPSKTNQQNEYLLILYDITEVMQLEQMHKDFISNISHELKTPTTSIIGFSETLLDGALEDPTVARDFIQIIHKEANRLYDLIQKILQLLQTEKTQPEQDMLRVPPQLVIEEELDRYQPMILEKELSIRFQLDELSELVPSEFFQPVVKNLLENAITYTEKKDIIYIRLFKRDEMLFFEVEDTGIGISDQDQQRLFERFYRVSKSRQRNQGGSGLGLSIVKHYVELLHGTVFLTSHLGEGTKVTVQIPII